MASPVRRPKQRRQIPRGLDLERAFVCVLDRFESKVFDRRIAVRRGQPDRRDPRANGLQHHALLVGHGHYAAVQGDCCQGVVDVADEVLDRGIVAGAFLGNLYGCRPAPIDRNIENGVAGQLTIDGPYILFSGDRQIGPGVESAVEFGQKFGAVEQRGGRRIAEVYAQGKFKISIGAQANAAVALEFQQRREVQVEIDGQVEIGKALRQIQCDGQFVRGGIVFDRDARSQNFSQSALQFLGGAESRVIFRIQQFGNTGGCVVIVEIVEQQRIRDDIGQIKRLIQHRTHEGDVDAGESLAAAKIIQPVGEPSEQADESAGVHVGKVGQIAESGRQGQGYGADIPRCPPSRYSVWYPARPECRRRER